MTLVYIGQPTSASSPLVRSLPRLNISEAPIASQFITLTFGYRRVRVILLVFSLDHIFIEMQHLRLAKSVAEPQTTFWGCAYAR